MALDVGTVRIGVATADSAVQIASPLTTIANDDTVLNELQTIIKEQSVEAIVVGLPRNLNGDDTAQTALAREFADRIETEYALPVHLQDEALTSVKAEQELKGRAKPYEKADIDALAATYILEDYLNELRGSV